MNLEIRSPNAKFFFFFVCFSRQIMVPKIVYILLLTAATYVAMSDYLHLKENTIKEEIASDGISNEMDSHIRPTDVEVAAVNIFNEKLHKQFEGKHGEVAKESLEVTEEDVGALGNIEVLTTAQGVQQESGNNTANATDLPGDASNSTSTHVSCTIGRETVGEPVELVNSTRLLNLLITEPNITNRHSTGDCVLLLFYAQYCPFSSMAAPHFNALARAFPDIKIAAVDVMKHHSFNTQYGIVGVPTVMLFHNGRPAAKFNDSEYTLEMFSRFVTKYTGMEPHSKLFVTSADFGGPVPSVPIKETDYCLALSWIFILVCGVYFFSKSTWWRWIVETIQNTWREAEAQNEHVD